MHDLGASNGPLPNSMSTVLHLMSRAPKYARSVAAGRLTPRNGQAKDATKDKETTQPHA
jgi:hypothetical protein